MVCSLLYYFALHTDLNSLRNGVTFVLDSKQNDFLSRVGNEGKLLSLWQAMPLRPQRIFILSASFLKRTVINALISMASFFFFSAKIISRIRFADLEEVMTDIAEEALPVYVGGAGGGFSDDAHHFQWILDQNAAFPTFPPL